MPVLWGEYHALGQRTRDQHCRSMEKNISCVRSRQGQPMGYMRLHLPWRLPFFLAMVVSSAFPVIAQRDSAKEQAKQISPKFIDTTSLLGINFRNMASHTSKKYLIETMAPGVAYLTTTTTGVWIFSSSTGRRSPTRRPRELSRRS